LGLARAVEYDHGLAEGKGGIILISTKFSTTDTWQRIKDLEEHFRQPVFVLTRDVRERFGLERVPSIITAQGAQFVINEVFVQENAQ